MAIINKYDVSTVLTPSSPPHSLIPPVYNSCFHYLTGIGTIRVAETLEKDYIN
jgi:hypothetical protein